MAKTTLTSCEYSPWYYWAGHTGSENTHSKGIWAAFGFARLPCQSQWFRYILTTLGWLVYYSYFPPTEALSFEKIIRGAYKTREYRKPTRLRKLLKQDWQIPSQGHRSSNCLGRLQSCLSSCKVLTQAEGLSLDVTAFNSLVLLYATPLNSLVH